MSKDKNFKKLVRLRMQLTGESYSTARRFILDSASNSQDPFVRQAAAQAAKLGDHE